MFEKIFDNIGQFAEDVGKEAEKAAKDTGKAVEGVVNEAGKVVDDIGNNMKKVAGDAGKLTVNTINDLPNNIQNLFKKEDVEKIVALCNSCQKKYSIWTSSKILYYLMMVDSEVSDKEMEKLELILEDIDNRHIVDRHNLINDCTNNIDNDKDKSRRLIKIQDKVERELIESDDKDAIPAKFLLSNMLAIAYSDGIYSENEKQLIQYFTLRMEIPIDIALELENTLLAYLDVERELDTVVKLDRYYREIAPIVESLNDRKELLYNNLVDLINL